jgi:ADP-heptose:LPS heptosyltransferase
VDALDCAGCMPRNKAAPIRDTPADTELSVTFTTEELQAYRSKVESDHPVTRSRQLVLVYAGGGILPERAWPAAHYARVVQGLCAAGHAVGLIGLKDDAVLARDLKAEVGHDACIDLTGYTKSIRELLMLMHASALLITNDGGPSHFATVTPIQTMVFFGPETGKLYGPLGQRTIILESGIACSPCLSAYNNRLTFCDGDNQCLKRIAPDPVLANALAFLQTAQKAVAA